MKRVIKSITPTKDIIVVETPVNDEVIYNLQADDDNIDEQLKFVIKAYAAYIEDNEDIEILTVGNSYLVTENAVYIAVYEDEWDEENSEI
jgi:hypothetical protein